MNTKKTIMIISMLQLLVACHSGNNSNDNSWSELPEVTPLETLTHTDFNATLENPMNRQKNIIYAPAFLYAWDKIAQELNSKIITSHSNSDEFILLTQSKSFHNSLSDDEYTIHVDYNGDEIMASAFFNKTLPFETKLQKLDNPIAFKQNNVAGFGMHNYDEEVTKQCEILYYNNDNHFILKLIPKDKLHEIILVKGLSTVNTLAEALRETNKLIKKGVDAKAIKNNRWKYEILPSDIIAIPNLKFNIATNYLNLVGQKFITSDKKNHIVTQAYQRTGFILNENGAVVESEALVATDSSAEEVMEHHPKQMVFDSTFYIIIKRTDKINPYFVMKVENNELMTLVNL